MLAGGNTAPSYVEGTSTNAVGQADLSRSERLGDPSVLVSARLSRRAQHTCQVLRVDGLHQVLIESCLEHGFAVLCLAIAGKCHQVNLGPA